MEKLLHGGPDPSSEIKDSSPVLKDDVEEDNCKAESNRKENCMANDRKNDGSSSHASNENSRRMLGLNHEKYIFDLNKSMGCNHDDSSPPPSHQNLPSPTDRNESAATGAFHLESHKRKPECRTMLGSNKRTRLFGIDLDASLISSQEAISGYLPASSSTKNFTFRGIGIDPNEPCSSFDGCAPPRSKKPHLEKKPSNHCWKSSSSDFHVDSSVTARELSMVYPYMSDSSYGYNRGIVEQNAQSLHSSSHTPGYFPYMADSREAATVPHDLNSSTCPVGPPVLRLFFPGAARNTIELNLASSPPEVGTSGGSRSTLELNFFDDGRKD